MVKLTGPKVQVALVVFLVKEEINLFLLVTGINSNTNRSVTDHEKRFHGLRSKGILNFFHVLLAFHTV